MSTSKKAASNLVHSVEVGSIVIDIFRGAAPDGHAYLYYQPARSWQPASSARRNYSQRFYERNERELLAAVTKASQWIRKHPEAADSPPDEPAPQTTATAA